MSEYYGRAYRKPTANSIYRVRPTPDGCAIMFTMDGKTWCRPSVPDISKNFDKQPSAQGALDIYAEAHGWEPIVETAEESSAVALPESAAVKAPVAFDYSGLDEATVDTLHLAERMIQDARRDFILKVADAVAVAHEALCGGVVHNVDNSKHGNRGEDSFRVWCESVNIGKSSAYKLLQVSSLFNSSTPVEQQVLEQASPSLLYEAAKPSAPQELVQAVKDGDITTHKQYKELLAEKKQAEARAEKAESRVNGLEESYRTAHENEKCAVSRCKEAEKRAAEAEKERDGARQALTAAKLRGDKLKDENEALRAQAAAPAIEAKVADADEVARLAAEKARSFAAERDEQDARDAYDAVILAGRQLDALWQILAPRVRQIDPNQRGVLEGLAQKLTSIKEEVCKCL